MSSPTRDARVRIGDTERDAAAAALGEHFAAGRLTREEFDERLENAWAARTAEDIAPLFVDLPGVGNHLAPVRTGRREPVGFRDRTDRRAVGPGRQRRSGPPPPLVFVLLVALVITLVSSLPFILVALGFFFFIGAIGHGCQSRRNRWAQSR